MSSRRLFCQPCDSSWKRLSLEAESLLAWQAAGSCLHHRLHQEEFPGERTQELVCFFIDLIWAKPCKAAQIRKPYCSFKDDIIGVHHQVVSLLQPCQLVLVPCVRSAAMMLHDLTHAKIKSSQKKCIHFCSNKRLFHQANKTPTLYVQSKTWFIKNKDMELKQNFVTV